MKRPITSTLMALVFIVLSVSGVLSYFTEYTRKIATIHTVFGAIFTLITFVHLLNNGKALKQYFKHWLVIPSFVFIGFIAFLTLTNTSIVNKFINFGARSKTSLGVAPDQGKYAEIITTLNKEVMVDIEIKKAKHFWHPQIAVWTEDTLGNYLETLYVTKVTAKGIFSGGRTKENFKQLDAPTKNDSDGYRRVNALPVWSHKRGVIYADGLPVPTVDDPLPDGISGATPSGNFLLKSSMDYSSTFVLKFEINVAFDDNEYYSEFDFADDSIFHNGTGQLGQPSLIYSSKIDILNKNGYFLLNLEGHGHHSGQNGFIYQDLTKLTTAFEIIEYILVGFKK